MVNIHVYTYGVLVSLSVCPVCLLTSLTVQPEVVPASLVNLTWCLFMVYFTVIVACQNVTLHILFLMWKHWCKCSVSLSISQSIWSVFMCLYLCMHLIDATAIMHLRHVVWAAFSLGHVCICDACMHICICVSIRRTAKHGQLAVFVFLLTEFTDNTASAVYCIIHINVHTNSFSS